ncbi:BON domain-containing protein [Bacteriovorax sp. PP10]|uniref:BON domain-containing protein n=1 Tax=Bacteriovorax antarcticus TaxID=3088717 RepID=A0ABU5VT85_9BACT|nr:BON domain-containing protein [Bacteriovorax sp. PP10]MEA9356259.1 BON domain-containing protein [Bacteriovorax sp. PP10]
MNRNHQSQNTLHHRTNYPDENIMSNSNYRSDGPGPVEIESVNNENFIQSFRGKGPKGYIRSDERIEEEVCKILARDRDIDASSIDVKVENGIVKLTGPVRSRQEKFAIEDAVENVSGINEVKNDIKVQKNYDAFSYEF